MSIVVSNDNTYKIVRGTLPDPLQLYTYIDDSFTNWIENNWQGLTYEQLMEILNNLELGLNQKYLDLSTDLYSWHMLLLGVKAEMEATSATSAIVFNAYADGTLATAETVISAIAQANANTASAIATYAASASDTFAAASAITDIEATYAGITASIEEGAKVWAGDAAANTELYHVNDNPTESKAAMCTDQGQPIGTIAKVLKSVYLPLPGTTENTYVYEYYQYIGPGIISSSGCEGWVKTTAAAAQDGVSTLGTAKSLYTDSYGNVTGWQYAGGSGFTSTFGIQADKFYVANSAGTALPPFTIDSTVTPPEIVFNGRVSISLPPMAEHLGSYNGLWGGYKESPTATSGTPVVAGDTFTHTGYEPDITYIRTDAGVWMPLSDTNATVGYILEGLNKTTPTSPFFSRYATGSYVSTAQKVFWHTFKTPAGIVHKQLTFTLDTTNHWISIAGGVDNGTVTTVTGNNTKSITATTKHIASGVELTTTVSIVSVGDRSPVHVQINTAKTESAASFAAGSSTNLTIYAGGDFIAATGIPAAYHVIGDSITINNNDTTYKWSRTFYFNGSTGWVSAALLVDGDIIVNGAVSANKLISNALQLTSSTTGGARYIAAGGPTPTNDTTWDDGNGLFLGYPTGVSSPRFYVGDGAKYIKWDGSDFTVAGGIIATTSIASNAVTLADDASYDGTISGTKTLSVTIANYGGSFTQVVVNWSFLSPDISLIQLKKGSTVVRSVDPFATAQAQYRGDWVYVDTSPANTSYTLEVTAESGFTPFVYLTLAAAGFKR